MFNSKTPATLFVNQLHTLRSHLPGVREGHESSVHDSRVATRRIRELLQFAARSSPRTAEELSTRFNKMGKALGRVRDVDVRIDLISDLERRIPRAAAWLVTVRNAQEGAREKLVRRLIKRLEKLEIERLINHATARRSSLRRVLERAWRSGRWRHDLCRMVTTRARTSTESIEHATGMYFPNRLHGVRIALKKLRYAMEIADDTGSPDLESPLRDLKKAQDVLGDLHDCQTLLDELSSKKSAGSGENPDTLVTLVKQVVEADAHRLHKRYLSRREGLLGIAREVQEIRIGRPWVFPSLVTATAGAVALTSGAYALQRLRTEAPAAPGPAVSRFGSRAMFRT